PTARCAVSCALALPPSCGVLPRTARVQGRKPDRSHVTKIGIRQRRNTQRLRLIEDFAWKISHSDFADHWGSSMTIARFAALPVAVASLFFAAASARADDGVSADKIVFGQVAALEGPASALGQGMKLGLEAAFAEANKAGGVKGR